MWFMVTVYDVGLQGLRAQNEHVTLQQSCVTTWSRASHAANFVASIEGSHDRPVSFLEASGRCYKNEDSDLWLLEKLVTSRA